VSKHVTYICLFLIHFANDIHAQNKEEFAFFESRLVTLANKILSEESDSLKRVASRLLEEDLEELFLLKGSFNYDFESIEELSILKSSDKKIKLYNWVIPLKDGTFEYCAYIQFSKKRAKDTPFIKLYDISHLVENESSEQFYKGEWYGALYSELLHHKFNKKNYYTLIGWDGNNSLTTKRLVDILHFNDERDVVWGAPIIKMNDGTHHRMVIEYSKKTSAQMVYNPDLDYIVFDHLHPMEGAELGMYEYYITSLNFNGLTFKNGKWRFVENIPAYNDKSQDGIRIKNIQRGLEAPE